MENRTLILIAIFVIAFVGLFMYFQNQMKEQQAKQTQGGLNLDSVMNIASLFGGKTKTT